MITIQAQIVDGVVVSERELTTQEKNTVTSQLFNGTECIYYQGDEPNIVIPEVKIRDWHGLEQQLRYSAEFAKAFQYANSKGFNLFTTTLVNGKLGHSTENGLSFAFSLLGVEWTEQEKANINTALASNNFDFRLT